MAAASRGMIVWRALAAASGKGSVWLIVLGLYLAAGVISPAMFQIHQVLNILQVAAFLGAVAAGQTIALLVAGIDLSQAGMVTLTNILSTSVMMGQADRIVEAVAVCLFVAVVVGAVNGLFVAALGVTPLIVTLGMNSVLYGAALIYTGGAPRGAAPQAFQVLGSGSLSGVPISMLIWIALALALDWLTRRTVVGRWLYAVGANPRAAELMGVPVGGVLILAYVISAVMAGVGGLLITAYIGAPSLGIGNQFLLTSIAAVVVGGAALSGGVGSVVATIGGAIFITELASFTDIVRVSSGVQFVIQGLIIALSVLAYRHVSGAAQ